MRAEMIQKIDEYSFLLPASYKPGMRIDGMIYANEKLLQQIVRDQTVEQVANVATLPGLVGQSLAMPDAHQGYGFCIGGVAASDLKDGVVSAGGVGFDINCGVRLLASPFFIEEIRPQLPDLLNQLFRDIPCGTGKSGLLEISNNELDQVLANGAAWAIQEGYGAEGDLAFIEESGRIPGADPEKVSRRAKQRGRDQLGTLGSGNHFLEVQVVEEVFDSRAGDRLGLTPGRVVVLLHSGSRGLGHQVCTDYLDLMQGAMQKHGIKVIDRQLACVPIQSQEGEDYLAAMAAAANFAFANRQMMTHWTRNAFSRIFGFGPLRIVYDVCHNMAKHEEHQVGWQRKRVLVHRKGATRAFPPRHPALPPELRDIGQPVLIPGSMGTCSYVLIGTEQAMQKTFGSCCHGAGRAMSRAQAKKETSVDELMRDLKRLGVLVRGQSRSGLAEENPGAYKDVSQVVEVVHKAGLASKVAKLVPVAVMKG
jgi:tRNA-splicing ligase RtcB (3'-phosphate/5'-hydroxy nucleic acid ligase)